MGVGVSASAPFLFSVLVCFIGIYAPILASPKGTTQHTKQHTMKFNLISTSDYGTFKTGSYSVNGKQYRVNGIQRGYTWTWTLAHDMTDHSNLSQVKAHLLSIVA